MITSCKKDNSTTDTASLYIPTAADATSSATLQELLLGRDLYIGNCGACHALVSPDARTAASWKAIIPTMAPRTSMNTTQVSLVTKYVCRGK